MATNSDEVGYEDVRRLVDLMSEVRQTTEQLTAKGYEVTFDIYDTYTIGRPVTPVIQTTVKKKVYP